MYLQPKFYKGNDGHIIQARHAEPVNQETDFYLMFIVSLTNRCYLVGIFYLPIPTF